MNVYSSDLITQLDMLRRGIYYSPSGSVKGEPMENLGIGAACYPNLYNPGDTIKVEIANMRRKVEAGADYFVTQVIADIEKFFRFLESVRGAGIDAHVIPELWPLTNYGQIPMLENDFRCKLPAKLMNEIEKYRRKPKAERNQALRGISADWNIGICEKLKENGVPGAQIIAVANAPLGDILTEVIDIKSEPVEEGQILF